MEIEQFKYGFLFLAIVFLTITVMFCLYRAVKGPRLTDTLLGVNVINVKTVVIITLLAVLLEETYLVDVALVYSILGFIAVAVLSRIILKERIASPAYETSNNDERMED